MVMIPELKTAFCGCSVRTGTKIVGWVTMVLGVVEFISVSALIGILAFTVAATDDETMGKGAVKLLHESENPDVYDIQGMQTLHSTMMLLVGDVDPDAEPGDIGRQLKEKLQGIFTVIFFVLFVIFLLHILFTSLLLVGVYKNKSGYVLFYLVVSILGLVGFIPVIFSGSASFNFRISTLIGYLVQLYFTWIIYSFYRELRNSSTYSANLVLLPVEKHLDGDVPILAPAAIPNDYYYPQKK